MLIRSMVDANVPKFLSDDVVLFNAIVRDLFPGMVIADKERGELDAEVRLCLDELGLQSSESIIVDKALQLYETMLVRHTGS